MPSDHHIDAMIDPWDYQCPACEAGIQLERWEYGPQPCPACGAALRTEHDCAYDAETHEEWCVDWCEIVGEVTDGE